MGVYTLHNESLAVEMNDCNEKIGRTGCGLEIALTLVRTWTNRTRSCVIVMLGLWSMSALAAGPVPAAPQLAAESWLLIDHDSGLLIAEHNADQRVEPASLTKMLTMYVVMAELAANKIRLDDQVLVSKKAWKMPGSRMFIEVDTKVPVMELIKGVVIQSGNDASVALAEHIAGDETAFSDLMNQYAKRIGLHGSHFVNASGLPDPEHYTTARDMATLASALIRDFPEHYPLHAQKDFVYNGITQYNRN